MGVSARRKHFLVSFVKEDYRCSQSLYGVMQMHRCVRCVYATNAQTFLDLYI